MLSVSEAKAIVLQHASPLPPENVPLGASALGRVLAEDVTSDMDMPPHDKSLMDGYAVRSGDLADGRAELAIVEEITAGRVPQRPLGPGQTARIMTGAPVPVGADAVVLVERSRTLDDNRVLLEDRPQPGQNILARAREMRRGETVLAAGTVLRSIEFGVLASVGRTSVSVYPAPSVAVLPTGDELVDPSERPGSGQIRNSNGPMLLAQVLSAGGAPRPLGIARDRAEHLRPLIVEGLRSSILILSGGVSAGKLDLVPGMLQELGVQALFHKVAMRPGKPVFFGVLRTLSDSGRWLDVTPSTSRPLATLVFGLPGNPVSSLVCFELFVRPAIRRLAGHADPWPRWVRARLVEEYSYRSERPTYHPARLEAAEDGWRVRPVAWLGSGDLRSLTRANGLVLFPAGEHQHKAGERFAVLCLEDGGQ